MIKILRNMNPVLLLMPLSGLLCLGIVLYGALSDEAQKESQAKPLTAAEIVDQSARSVCMAGKIDYYLQYSRVPITGNIITFLAHQCPTAEQIRALDEQRQAMLQASIKKGVE